MRAGWLVVLVALAAPAVAAPHKHKHKHPKHEHVDPPPPPPPPVEVEPEPEPVAEPVAAPLAEPAQPVAEALAVAPAPRHGARRFYVRAGAAIIKPLSSSRPMELADVDGAASLAVSNGPIEGSGATVGSAATPAVIIGYDLTDHVALETVLGMPFTVKFEATGTLATESIAPTALGLPTGVGPLGSKLGEATAAPPLVTVVYKLRAPENRVRPFVGAGAAVLLSYNAHVTNPMLIAVSEPAMSVAPAPGLVLQAGVEARLTKRWFARLDAKYIAFMLARAEVTHVQVETPDLPLFQTVEVGTAKMSVWVNPLIIQLGVGANF